MSDTGVLTIAQAQATVRRLLADPDFGPDYQADCLYADRRTNAPVCLVGHILAEWLPVAFAKASKREGTGVNALVDRGAFGCSDLLASALCEAQGLQDRRVSWGIAAEPILELSAEEVPE